MTLSLNHSLDTLLANMKQKTRYNIRYAMRKNVTVQALKEKSQLGVFYCLLQETAKRDRFTIRSLDYFEAIWDHLVQAGLARVFLAYHEETPLAGAICFRLGPRVWYVYGASSSEKRNLQAPHLIQWEMIKWAKGAGCTIYNFRGVSGDLRPEHPLYGLYRFKEGFGATLETYVGEFDLPIRQGGYALWLGGLRMHNWIRRYKKAGPLGFSAWVEVNLSALEHNLQLAKGRSPTPILPILKGDAYGHGAPVIAAFLKSKGCSALGVSTVEEALDILEWTNAQIVLLTPPLPEQLPAVVERGMIPTITSPEVVPQLNRLAKLRKRVLTVQIKVDTGFGRLGVAPAGLCGAG